MKNKTKRVFAMLVTLSMAATSMSALAGENGSNVGNGGDTRCAKFYELASQVSIELAKLGQDEVNKVNPLINVQKMRDIAMHPLVVLPVTNLDRQARSNADTVTTLLDVEKWDKISDPFEKYRLISHELMVLSKIEADGEYTISHDLMQLLMLKTKIALAIKSKSYLINPDGSYTIFTPFFIDLQGKNKKYIYYNRENYNDNLDGICIYLGMKRATSKPVYSYIPNNYSVKIGANGEYLDERSDTSFFYSISCM